MGQEEKEKERRREREIFKDLAHAVVSAGKKLSGQAPGWRPREQLCCFLSLKAIFRQNFFLLGVLSLFLLRPSTDWITHLLEHNLLFSKSTN